MPSKYDESGFNLTKGAVSGYENYFLMGDPFPPFTITDEEPEIFVDRKELMSELEKFITTTFSSGDSDAFVVLGDYGHGKTHILKYLKKEINGVYANLVADRAIAVYVRPGGSMLDFVSNFVGSLGLAFFSQTVDEYIKSLPPIDRQMPTSARDLFGYPMPLLKPQSTTLDRVREAMASDLLQTIGSNDLLSVLVAFASRADRLTAWSWLKGMPITAQDRKRINVAAALKEDNALEVLDGLVSFLHRVGYKMSYILFDELEEVSELKDETRRFVYLNYLRQFIDDNPKGLAFIFGATVAGWDALGKSAEALERRIVYSGRLSNFSLEDTLNLTQKYLERGHDRYFESTGKDKNELQKLTERNIDPQFFPFSQTAIAKVLELAQYKVGYVLRGLKILMKVGYMQGKYYATENDVINVIPTADVLETGV